MRGLIDKFKRNLADFGQDESGMGVIEVILIILDNSLLSITYV